MALTVRTVYERLWHETNDCCKRTGRTDIPFFLYLDRESYEELKYDSKSPEVMRQFGEILHEQRDGTILFAQHKVFIVNNARFHFNIKEML